MAEKDATSGPVILWLNYGAYEGWQPRSFDTIKEALCAERYSNNEFVITRLVQYEVRETSISETMDR